MKRLFLIAVVFGTIMVSSRYSKNYKAIQISLLEKDWTHSFEEKTSEEIEIYRPSDYKDFPISRYRQIFKFDANNVCRYLVLSPDDAHYMEDGRWEYNPKTSSIKVFKVDSEVIYNFEIVELTDTVLKVKS